MDTELTITTWQPGRAGRATARYRSARAEIEPPLASFVGFAALGALRHRRGRNARTGTQVGGEA